MTENRTEIDGTSSKGRSRSTRNRSRLTNGAVVDADRRGAWARRLRDLVEIHLGDLGGIDAVSAAERSIVHRAAVLMVELELLEVKFATSPDGAQASDLDLYQRTSNSMRRLLETVGLQRRAKDVTPTLDQLAEQMRANRKETP